MREECRRPCPQTAPSGITPAHAGRIHQQVWKRKRLRDHPRACGKNFSISLPFVVVVGSPPRMREEFCHFLDVRITRRITPAHAGRMTTSTSSKMTIRGSPPRMREESLYKLLKEVYTRITPAHAGRMTTIERTPGDV